MGGAFSAGQDNDELIDNLVDSGYLRTKRLQQVFRAVDRGDYFLQFHRDDAYKDFAWKHGNIHLSAPCIYCEVLEELSLQAGQSFLNIGSGTGYLSTIAGLLITQSGINHGIELHEDCVKYAYDRLEEFKQKSLALDEYDFCEPIFVQGNFLNAVQGQQYDRVYCGATCPEFYEALIKEFVKVGGILIMPFKDHLIRATRIDENSWEHVTILPVSFTSLILPKSNDVACHLPSCDPLSLQELCRGKIRRRLRQNVRQEHTDLESCKSIPSEHNRRSPPHRALSQFIIPIFGDSDDEMVSEDDEFLRTQILLNIDSPAGENLRTTLQFMRAVIQPNRRNDSAATAVTAASAEVANADDEYEMEEHLEPTERLYSPMSSHNYSEREQITNELCQQENVNCPEDEESPSTEDTNFSSECERQTSESSSESHNLDNSDKNHDRPPTDAYSNMSESESEPEHENKSEADNRRCSPLIEQRQKMSRLEPSDIIDNVSTTTGNDEGSMSSDSDFVNGTPVKQKRSSSSGNSSCSASSSGSNYINRNRNNTNIGSNSRRKRSSIKIGVRKSSKNGYYFDTNAFSSYMKEKIHQLPLPYPLKKYINYNRTL